MIVAEQIPTDLVEAQELARDLADAQGRTQTQVYNRLKVWWNRGRIHAWKRPDGRVLLSESEVTRALTELRPITPRDGEEE